MSITATAAEVAEHVERFTDPDKLARHLRGIHAKYVLGVEQDDLSALRDLHQAAHANHATATR